MKIICGKYYVYIQGESKKVWFAAPVAKFYFFVELFCEKFLKKIFWYFDNPKRIGEPFFLTKSKVQKNKNV